LRDEALRMGRIPEAELDRIKREVSVLDRVRAAGVALKRHGANWLGRCLFHHDRTPSLVVTPSKNLWHCLGACRAGGSVIDWVMRAERVSFRHAVELLRRDHPGAEAERRSAGGEGIPGGDERGAPVLALDPAGNDTTLLGAVVEYYHQTLLQSPEALAYLAKRGLDDRVAIEHFRLGFANRTLAYQLPSKTLKAGAALRTRLQRLGMLRASGHEHFNGSLVIPVISPTGEVTELYGRKIRDDLRAGTPKHLYLPGPHRGVWNLAALAGSTEVILCEALLDALTFWVAGYRNVTAAYGVRGFTAEHLAALQHYGTERVLIAYDRDRAGESAAQALAERLTQAGLACYRIQFPYELDANAYALKVRPAAKSLGLAIRHALWLGQGPVPQRTLGPAAEMAIEPREAHPASSLAADSPSSSAGLPVEPPPRELPVVSPEPPAPPPEIPVEVTDQEVTLTLGDRRYRVRGLAQNLSPAVLKVNLLVRRGAGTEAQVHVDTLDLYAARARAAFVAQAAQELGLPEDHLKKDLGQVLLKLEALQDQLIRAGLTPKIPEPVVLTQAERAVALGLLRDPRLVKHLLEDFARAGVVGEATNALVGYLAALSRKLPQPLAVIVQSASAAGKTALMEAVLAFVPLEDRVQYSAVTGQALFYLGETDLRHKVLAIVEEEGAERASYALKLLQSEGELTIASTGKDPTTGKLVTHTYRVTGPVMIVLTTTAVTLDEELLNRALVLTVNEDRAQTRAIHARQRARRTLEGLLAQEDRRALLTLHQNAQRLLEPVAVVNPFAPQLTFLDARLRTRRDHEKYLTLIDAIALLHQHQRERKTVTRQGQPLSYIEVTRADIALANRLAAEVLGRSLDELPPQTRRFLTVLDRWIDAESQARRLARSSVRVTAREIREALGLGATQVKCHLHRLVELEYVLVHRAARGPGVLYELCYEGQGQDGAPFLPGLIDVAALTEPPEYDKSRSASAPHRSDLGRPPVGAKSATGRPADAGAISCTGIADGLAAVSAPLPARNGRPPASRSHVPAAVVS
jgi:DNA primase